MTFQRVIILGTGQLSVYCASRIRKSGYENVCIFDTNKFPSKILHDSCLRAGILYRSFCDYNELKQNILFQNTSMLLVSVVNPWIIPKDILDRPSIRAVNIHHSLLPRHAGRNAEAWAIFDGDTHTGITWHFITSQIDAGNIIIQKQIELDTSFTSLSLLRAQNKLAEQSFDQICSDLLNDSLIGVPQQIESKQGLHYSWEIPNEGFLNPHWPSSKISSFLRAMDYGFLKVLGDPKIFIDRNIYIWESYNILNNQTQYKYRTPVIINNDIFIYTMDNIYHLKKIREVGMANGKT